MRIFASAVPLCVAAASLLPGPAQAVRIDINQQDQYPLVSARYQPDARRLEVITELGNLRCGSGGETIPLGAYSLRLDGLDYRLSDINLGQQVFRYRLDDGSFEVNLTQLDEMPGEACASTGVSTANLRLRVDSEDALRLAQGVVYRTQSPRRLEVHVADPMICFDFGTPVGGLRLDLTDSNGELWHLPGVTLARYAHSQTEVRVELPDTASCFGFGGVAGATQPVVTGAPTDALFGTGFEIEEVYPDLAVSIIELPSALENVFRYRIEVTNLLPFAANQVRVRDFYPKIGVPRFVDGALNWSCAAEGAGASCGASDEGGGRVDLVGASLPGYLPAMISPPRLLIEVQRTLQEYSIGQPLAVQAAVTIAPPGRPDRDRNNNSASLQSLVSEPAGPVAMDDVFATDQDSPFAGNVFDDNGSGPDEHLNGLALTVHRVNGSEANVAVPVTLRSVTGGAPATVTVQSNGALAFDPGDAFVPVPANEVDPVQFSYTLRDIDGLESTATVTVEVTGLNDPPEVNDAIVELTTSGGTVDAPGVLVNSSDPDGDALLVTLVNGAAFGAGFITLPSGAFLQMESSGQFTYVWGGATVGGSDSFDVTVSDGEFDDTARITINFVP